MDNRIRRLEARTIVRYDVQQVDGRFEKTPVYSELPYTAQADDYSNQPYETYIQPEPEERLMVQSRRFKGKSMAKAAIVLSAAIGVTYGADVASTAVQKPGKIITINDAYQDLTELPVLVQPLIDAALTFTQFNSTKE